MGEGHFKNIDEVPTHAITLTIPALLAARLVQALVPAVLGGDILLHVGC
jgi:hypothetical protein